MDFTVPTIDISSYLHGGAADDEARVEVAKEIDRACSEVGFIQIVNHGIPSRTIDELGDALDEFFALPTEVKKQYCAGAGPNRGYQPPNTDSLSMSLGVAPANMMNDFYEAFTVGSEASWYPDLELPEANYATNLWPAAAPNFRSRVETYFAAAQKLSRVLLTAFSDALGLPSDYFPGLTDHSIDVLKMNNYMLPEGEIELAGELTGMGAHTDFGILTILWADRVAGLQVLDRRGHWHDVMPEKEALLINLGDAMARWTNDQWMSTVHRVNPPVVNGRIIRRRSCAFFFDGNYDAIIEPLNGFGADNEPVYPPISIADNINAKLAGVRLGKVPSAVEREAQRVLSAHE